MKRYLLALYLTGAVLAGCGSAKNATGELAVNAPIESYIDLAATSNDRVPVVIDPGKFNQDTVVYRLPKVVPGTYKVSDFGSFVDDFKALDYEGKAMEVKQLDANSWVVYQAGSLDRISYWVNDTFDIEGGEKHTPFSPTGTNIAPDIYVLNLHGFIGYFDSLKNNSYRLEVTSPAELVRNSALPQIGERKSEDGKTVVTQYKADRYFDITDNPMMYGDLDVEEFQVEDIRVVLSVYSPNKVHSASSLKEAMYAMMKAQKNFLGDINSTKRYDIYVYLADHSEGAPKGFGALEHHTSTVVVLPEGMPTEMLNQQMIDVVSHEFFHILTPLTVHSEDVHYFDYHQPTFSKHLWMYEGLTEYFANLFQVDQGLISEEEFYSRMMQKIHTAATMDDAMSFTVMSENVLDQPYARNYYNVYQKGALIGMCLDILIREESQGEKGILWLMKELSAKYGKDRPFEDDRLIAEIVDMTYPSVGTFFEKHVIGNTPIDYQEYFAKSGLIVLESRVETNYVQNAGANIVKLNSENNSIDFSEAVLNNSFWRESGALPGDTIREIDGVPVTLENAEAIFVQVYMWKPGADVSVKLERNGQEVIIEKTLTPSYTMGQILVAEPNASESQKLVRSSWLKG